MRCLAVRTTRLRSREGLHWAAHGFVAQRATRICPRGFWQLNRFFVIIGHEMLPYR
jgi:hypothetical protein